MISGARLQHIGGARLLLDVSDRTLFLLIMAVVIFSGSALQLLIIPFALPQIHSGDGLAGGDWSYFHTLALQQADAVMSEGWKAWLLRPEGQAPAGIASIFYVLIYPKPIVLLPLNGALFAATIVAARSILTHMFGDRRAATLGLLPFLLFPTFATIWGQLHKDIFVGAGLLLIFESLIRAKLSKKSILLIGSQAALGAALVWIARGYALEIICISCVVFLASTCTSNIQCFLRTALVVFIIFLGAVSGHKSGLIAQWSTPSPSLSVESPAANPPGTIIATSGSCEPAPSNALDGLMYSVCRFRSSYLSSYPGAGGNLTQEPRLRFFDEFVGYLPRALAIGLFEPFPFSMSTPASPIGSIGRTVANLEMTIAYIAFISGFLMGWRHLLAPTVLGALGFFLAYILIYSFACPNIGTLYRERLFAHTMLISMMIAVVIVHSRRSPATIRSDRQ